MTSKIKIFSLLTVFLNIVYLFWFIQHIESGLGWVLLLAELLILSNLLLFIFNSWKQEEIGKSSKAAEGTLDVFVTVVNEPLSLFEKTLAAAATIQYHRKIVYVLDDGKRDVVKALAAQYGAEYVVRSDNKHYKAGNLNHGLAQSTGEFILVMDADQIAKSTIAADSLGHFHDPEVAIVTTQQSFSIPKKDFNRDYLFYDHIQTGSQADNAAFSNGSGVFYRRTALHEIKGFDTWNVVEDLTTTYKLHCRGWKSVYAHSIYSVGTAPMSVPTIYKQRGTWALDSLRLFFRLSLFKQPGLTWRQKMHYFEICWQYVVSAISTPILCLLPATSLFLNTPIIPLDGQYILFRTPSMLLILYFYYLLNGKSFASGQYWTALWAVYLKALFLALGGKKAKYIVTNKVPVSKVNIRLIFPHLFCIVASLSALLWRVVIVKQPLQGFVGVYIFWFCIMIFWFYPIIKSTLFPSTKLEELYLEKLQFFYVSS